MPDNQQQRPKSRFFQGNRKTIAMATGAAIAVASVFGVHAFAGSDTYAHLKVAAGFDGGWHGHKRLADMSETEIKDRVTRLVAHVAIEIDATPEQQSKIVTLVTALAKDVQPLQNRLRDTGVEIHDLLVADTIDRDALEKLRAARFAEAEMISKNLVNAAADVAEVLTPEQRKVLEERIREFRFMRHRHRRG